MTERLYTVARSLPTGPASYWRGPGNDWTTDLTAADWTSDEADAERLAGDWNAYFEAKQMLVRAYVYRTTIPELEAIGWHD